MLNRDQVEEFRATGVLVVEDVLPDSVLAAVKSEYQNLANGLLEGNAMTPSGDFEADLLALHRAGIDWFQTMDISLPGDRIKADTPFHIGPAVFDMLTAPELLDVVQCLIGPEISSTPIQHVRIKPPVADLADGEVRAHVGGTDWHQDRGVALEEADDTQMITVWIAITDATPENGCLTAVPRVSEMLPHCPMRQTTIAPGALDTSTAMPLPVGAGGVVILDPYIPHAALDNRSDGIRWSFDLRYHVTGQPSGRAHFPEFVARSVAAPETALSDWRAWKDMWTDARARLADAPHIEQHRWQADAPACA